MKTDRARREVENMGWPDRIDDPQADRVRELKARLSASRRSLLFWRAAVLFLLAVIAVVVLTDVLTADSGRRPGGVTLPPPPRAEDF